MSIRTGDRVRVNGPIAYRGRMGTIIEKRRHAFWHPTSKYVVQIDGGPVLLTGAVSHIKF